MSRSRNSARTLNTLTWPGFATRMSRGPPSWGLRAGVDRRRPVHGCSHEGQPLSILRVEIGNVADVDADIAIEAVTAQPVEHASPVHRPAARRQMLVVAAVIVGRVHVRDAPAEFLDRQRQDLFLRMQMGGIQYRAECRVVHLME